jgi:hypothetical protein
MHADRNMDVIMLHPNASDIQMRLSSGKDRPLPLDGLLSQHGEVFFKVQNYNSKAFSLTLSQGYAHSPFLDQHLKYFSSSPQPNTTIAGNCTWSSCDYSANGAGCDSIDVPPRAISEWHEVGRYLDTLNHGTWLLEVKYAAIIVGIRSANGSIVPIARFPDEGEHAQGDLFMLFDASTRAFGRMRKPLDDFEEVMCALDDQTAARPPHGHPPVRTTIFAQTFADPPTTYPGATPLTLTNASHTNYSAKRQKFLHMFGLSDAAVKSAAGSCTNTSCMMMGLWLGSADKSNLTVQCETQLQKKLATGVEPAGVQFVSLGDEITLECSAESCDLSDLAFEEWARSRNLSLAGHNRLRALGDVPLQCSNVSILSRSATAVLLLQSVSPRCCNNGLCRRSAPRRDHTSTSRATGRHIIEKCVQFLVSWALSKTWCRTVQCFDQWLWHALDCCIARAAISGPARLVQLPRSFAPLILR